MTHQGVTPEVLAPQIVRVARGLGLTVATAESCTGGLVAAAITAVPGSSDVFVGGIVAYSNGLKTSLLGVESAVLREHGAVSPQTAAWMARGAAERLGADLVVAVTGIAGPSGGTAGKPVGTVCLGLYGPHGVVTDSVRFEGDRSSVREQSVVFALRMLADALEHLA